MTKVRRKVAVSVSPDVLAAAERLRKRTGESRSAVFERALHGLLAAVIPESAPDERAIWISLERVPLRRR